MGLPDLYPAQVGSPYTTLAAPYTTGESTMTLVDATKLPAAPNIVCLAGDVDGEFTYAGKDGNILQGVAALPGTPVATTWSVGAFAFRGISAYDLNAIHENMVRTATYVVAASDAPSHVKKQADYVCDGTDDQVEIQAAIDALPAEGGSVHLTAGTFSAATIILRSNVSLSGEGAATLLVCPAATSANVIQATPLSVNIMITDLTVDGNKAGNTDQSDVTLQNGIYLYNCGYWTIRNVYARNCHQTGISIGGIKGTYNHQHGEIVGCHTTKNAVAGYSLLERTEYVVISACHSYSDYWGVHMIGGNNTVIGCTVTAANNGIRMESGSNAHGARIIGNQLNHCATGLHSVGPFTHSTIAANGFLANSFRGAYLYTFSDSLIAQNVFKHNGQYDLDLVANEDGPSSGNFIHGNKFIASPNSAGAVRDASTSVDNIVEGNAFSGYTTAVYLQGAGSRARNNAGYVTENRGAAASTTDGGTIPHGCVAAPTTATVSGSVAGEIVTVTSIDATNITVAIKAADGTTPGTTQTVYWRAEV